MSAGITPTAPPATTSHAAFGRHRTSTVTATSATNDLRDIPYIRGDDRYIAGHCFFDNIWRSFSKRSEYECITGIDVLGNLLVWQATGNDQFGLYSI